MKIQLISFINNIPSRERLELTHKVINESEADLLLFSANTILYENEIQQLRNLIINKDVEVIFGLNNLRSEMISNSLYHIKDSNIKNLYTNLLFEEEDEISYNKELIDRLVYEYETRRRLLINSLSILIIQGGEMNILRNIQDNKLEFVLSNDIDLTNRFVNIINTTDIFLHTIDSPLSNQRRINLRGSFLSKGNKYYFSSSNTKNGSKVLNMKNLQYAVSNTKELLEIDKFIIGSSISRVYEI